jgi:hypothetical protein
MSQGNLVTELATQGLTATELGKAIAGQALANLDVCRSRRQSRQL